MNEVKGFKVFNPDWTCRGKRYTCPGTFEEGVTPDVCNVGMHFCERLVDCFSYYSNANENYHVAEVIAHGEISRGEDNCITHQIMRYFSRRKETRTEKFTSCRISLTGLHNGQFCR